MSDPQHHLEQGALFPFDAPDDWWSGLAAAGKPAPPSTDWAHRAARGVVDDLRTRGRLSLHDIDEDTRLELVLSLAAIIQCAVAEDKPGEIAVAKPEGHATTAKRCVMAPYRMDLTEGTLYDALERIGLTGGSDVTVRAREGYIRVMAEVNGHRHCLGLEPIRFVPLDPQARRTPGVWEVEGPDVIYRCQGAY